MGLKRLFLLVTLFFSALPSIGQEYEDVHQKGDIWVVTIDKSGSMIDVIEGYDRYKTLAENVFNRLLYGECLDSADFEKDRFLFLTSGITRNKKNIPQEMKAAGPLDQSFIHATDGKLYSFANKRACAKHIYDLVIRRDYVYKMSFVSQIRLFSVIHTVNLLKSRGDSNSFDGFKMLTITDDADQYDQWMTDYRNLKKWAPWKVQEVSEDLSQYIYNDLNGKGQGYMEEVTADEDRIPHLWVFRYRSKQQDVPESERDLLSLKASDGRTIQLVPKVGDIEGDSLCFFHIDSIRINDNVIAIDTSFCDIFSKKCFYENGLQRNNVAIWGYAQVEYDDQIFGRHSKIVPFTQYQTVVPKTLFGIINAGCAFLLLLLAGLLVYLLIIRPRSLMFSIYSGTGTRTDVFRGFSSDWKEDTIPVQYYTKDENGKLASLTKRHKDIRIKEPVLSLPGHENELLIASRRPMGISVAARSIDTGTDIEEYYYTRSNAYPKLLQTHYESTVFHKLYKMRNRTYRMWVRRLLKFCIKWFNRCNKVYYYFIESVDHEPMSFIGPDRFFKDKRFSIQFAPASTKSTRDINQEISDGILTSYYSAESKAEYDLIVGSFSYSGETIWQIFKLVGVPASIPSLMNVMLIASFKEENIGDASEDDGVAIIRDYLKKAYPGFKIGQIKTMVDGSPFRFNILKATAPGFISFIESCEKPRSEILYSPIKDFGQKEKVIRINPRLMNGHLYLSLIPVDSICGRKSLMKRLSEKLVRNGNSFDSQLSLGENVFVFRDINDKY